LNKYEIAFCKACDEFTFVPLRRGMEYGRVKRYYIGATDIKVSVLRHQVRKAVEKVGDRFHTFFMDFMANRKSPLGIKSW
jgi:hypothetical protein